VNAANNTPECLESEEGSGSREQFLFLAMTQEALPALSNQNDDGPAGLRSRPSADAARDEKGHELRGLSLTRDTSYEDGPAMVRPFTFRHNTYPPDTYSARLAR
jgi:hypothetical protein